MFIQRLVPEASKQSKLQPVSVSSPGLNELYVLPLWSWRPLGSPAPAAGRGREVGPPQRSSGHQGALRSPLSRERQSQPGGCFSLSPSRALPSRPHIRVWSAAAAVSVGAGASGAGPGRSKWRRREAERRPRSAPCPRNFRLAAPQLSGKCCRSGCERKGKLRRRV